MIGKIFSFLSVISFITAILTGNTEAVCKGIIDGASKSVTVAFSLMGMMALWNGIMNVFKESGAIKKLSKILSPILKKIFPKSFESGQGSEEITACISANLLGISNAATPLGIRAIEELNKGNKTNKATNEMITLCIIGCACFNLLPSTVLALRAAYNAKITFEIILPVWICSGTCMGFGIILSKILGIKDVSYK